LKICIDYQKTDIAPMSKEKSTRKESSTPQQFVFGKENYYLMIASVATIIVGFTLMTGSEGDIFDFRRLTLAPIVVLAGFVIGIFAIMRKSKS